jgi:UDP-glucose 4-epimerase
VIHCDSQQSRDFSYIDDVVEANLMAMKAHTGFGEAFNVAFGQCITLPQLASSLRSYWVWQYSLSTSNLELEMCVIA